MRTREVFFFQYWRNNYSLAVRKDQDDVKNTDARKRRTFQQDVLEKTSSSGTSGHRLASRSLDSLFIGLGGQVGYMNAVAGKWVDG